MSGIHCPEFAPLGSGDDPLTVAYPLPPNSLRSAEDADNFSAIGLFRDQRPMQGRLSVVVTGIDLRAVL